MSYTKDDLREAFYAGKLGELSFDSWLLKSKTYSRLVSLYQQCFVKIVDKPSSYGLNVKTEDCARLKHIIRGVLIQQINNITLDLICDIELSAGSTKKTDHTTIIHSVKKYNEKYQTHYITTQVQKIIKELNI